MKKWMFVALLMVATVRQKPVDVVLVLMFAAAAAARHRPDLVERLREAGGL